MIQVEWLYPIPGLRIRMRSRVRHLADFQRLHAAAGTRLMEWVRRNFRAHGALLEEQPGGWPALAPATLADRRRRGLGLEPLIATGRLYRSFTVRAGADAVEVANPVPYAARHQTGDGVPRRAFFPGPDQASRIVMPAVERHVQEALR